MTRTLLIRGMLVGVVAGLLAFTFAKVFGEPQVDLAIGFEDQLAKAAGEPDYPEIVSRGVQSTIGLFTGVALYTPAFGGLFALAFAGIFGRIGSRDPRIAAAVL